MGVLAGIAMWPVPDGKKVDLTLKGLMPRTRSMLSTLGLERIMHSVDENTASGAVTSEPSGSGVREVHNDAGKEETLETMRTAHQDLVRADKSNEARFCDVLTYLDQEIKRVDDK